MAKKKKKSKMKAEDPQALIELALTAAMNDDLETTLKNFIKAIRLDFTCLMLFPNIFMERGIPMSVCSRILDIGAHGDWDRYVVSLMKAQYQVTLGEPDVSGHIDTALKLEPDSLLAWFLKWLLSTTQMDDITAFSCRQKMKEIDPVKSEEMFGTAGVIFHEAGDDDLTMRAFQSAVGVNPERSTFHSAVGILYAEQANWDKAFPYLEKALEINPDDVDALFSLGCHYLEENNNLSQAVGLLSKAIRVDKMFAHAYHNLAQAYMMIDDIDKAVATLKKLLKNIPDDIDAHNTLAQIYTNFMNEPQKGVHHYRKVLAMEPENNDLWFELGSVYLEDLEDVDNALDAFQRCVRFDEDDTIAYYMLGECHRRKGNNEAAMDAFLRSISLRPDNAGPRNRIIQMLIEKQQLSDAREQARELLRLDPDSPLGYMRMGDIERETGNKDEGYKWYQKAIEMDPVDPSPYKQLGIIYNMDEDYDQAIEYLTKAVDIDPENAGTHFLLATVYGVKNNMEKFAEHITEADRLGSKEANQLLLQLMEMGASTES